MLYLEAETRDLRHRLRVSMRALPTIEFADDRNFNQYQTTRLEQILLAADHISGHGN